MKKFIPRIDDRTLLGDTKLGELFINAILPSWRPDVFTTIQDNPDVSYTIDPQTSKMFYYPDRYKDKKTQKMQGGQPPSIKQLPYSFSKKDKSLIEGNSAFRRDRIVRCIDFQIKNNARRIIPLYLHIADLTSHTFNINLESIATTVKNKNEKGWDHEIYPMIHVSDKILLDENDIRFLVSHYADEEFKPHVKGFYLMVDDFTGLEDVDTLVMFLKLVRALSMHGDLTIVNMGTFGYTALLVGANAFVSGLAGGETVSTIRWESKGSGPREKTIYVPEIFSYVSPEELDSTYKCDCVSCGGSKLKKMKANELKKHLFHCREKDIKSIFHQRESFTDRLGYLREIYSRGFGEIDKIFDNTVAAAKLSKEVIRTTLERWVGSLDYAEDIYNFPKAEDKLRDILKDLDEPPASSSWYQCYLSCPTELWP